MSGRLPEPGSVPLAWQVLVESALRRCADAGYGRIEELGGGLWRFEALPGLEDAAADFVEATLQELDR